MGNSAQTSPGSCAQCDVDDSFALVAAADQVLVETKQEVEGGVSDQKQLLGYLETAKGIQQQMDVVSTGLRSSFSGVEGGVQG